MVKIFAIYPTDESESTKFLNRINTYLNREIGNDWHCYKIKHSDEDHDHCLGKAVSSESKFILFMGHGRSDCLYGSCGKNSQEFVSTDAIKENQSFYKNEHFIHTGNIGLFKDKIFFSFSCSSNRDDSKSIGINAIKNGVTSFVGFGNIQTDYLNDINFPKRAIAFYKGIIIKVIKQSLCLAIRKNYTVEELVILIRTLATKEIQKMLLDTSKNRNKEIIIDNLFSFKKEIVIFGNIYARLN